MVKERIQELESEIQGFHDAYYGSRARRGHDPTVSALKARLGEYEKLAERHDIPNQTHYVDLGMSVLDMAEMLNPGSVFY